MFLSESIDEDSSDPMDSVINGGVSDSTSEAGGDASCQDEGAFNTTDKLYTGMCGEGSADTANQPEASSSSAAPPDAGCETGPLPTFSPVTFTGVGADRASLSSWNPKRYDLTAGATLLVQSGNLREQGQSFKDVFVRS